MLITKLDIINACLECMGEAPVNSYDELNPIATSAMGALDHCVIAEQAPGWWYNKETIKINPTVDGEFYVPTDVLSFDTDLNPPWLTQRGRRVYDRRVGEYYRDTNPLHVSIIRLVDFDDLPYQAKLLVRAATQLQFQSSFDADESKVLQAQNAYATAYQLHNAEHIRSVKANMIYQGGPGARVARHRFPTYRRGVN